MTVLSRRRILEFSKLHADAGAEFRSWFTIARQAVWKHLGDVRRHFPDVDQVGRVLVFNIRRNTYRLIVKVGYRSRLLMVKDLLSHGEYDKGAWKKWS